jgi:hypothetical protein
VRPASASEGASTAVCDGWDDDWALEIARQAIRYVAQHAQGVDYEALDLSEAHPAHDDMDAAALAGDRDAYLDAARRWTRAVCRAAERVRKEASATD